MHIKNVLLVFLILFVVTACKNQDQNATQSNMFLTDKIPGDTPIPFKPELVTSNKLVHRGIFSTDMETYYFTISNTDFSSFDVKMSRKKEGVWSTPVNAFFNSTYNEHGMSFSPDGNTLVFASTRSVDTEEVSDTWHLWKSQKQNGKWSEPQFIDIPNLRDKLMSHPTLTNDGILYFHSSNIDYSNMEIWYATLENDQYLPAKKLQLNINQAKGYCTPYISADGEHLIFAVIKEHLELNISHKTGVNEWSTPIIIPEYINHNGQGNPYLTPDGKFLFYATEDVNKENTWHINWVSTKSFINK
ncbi:hypothetical protein [Aquimarina sp. 2201CG5-10]|uniref:hypothetical protein n=1 Tax=Aquimarina callyspongiae TaxID=3098150 RepID=UPI002AB556CB|nr:hypothetical protein [Aquimarina sp. 2201CG5-10]MDY8138542.1 hypothetical protein [Aquimarina sp. 2201CG5-10]